MESIFTVDKTYLFYKQLPSKSYVRISEICKYVHVTKSTTDRKSVSAYGYTDATCNKITICFVEKIESPRMI